MHGFDAAARRLLRGWLRPVAIVFTIASILSVPLSDSLVAASATKVLPATTEGAAYSYSLATVLIPTGQHWRAPYRFSAKTGIAGIGLNGKGRLVGRAEYVGAKAFSACAYDSSGKHNCKTLLLRVRGSRYAGTYSGAFNYQYQNQIVPIAGDWIPMSFSVTLSMKDVNYINGKNIMKVTNFVSSESAYGTGTQGVVPVSPTWSWFWANPPASPTLRLSKPGADVLMIYLPNGSSLNVNFAYGFELSADGSSMQWIPTDPTSPPNWFGTISSEVCSSCAVNYLGWSLTKVSG
jgi:hypothetical protein